MKRKLFTATLAFVIAVASFVTMFSGCKPEDPSAEYLALETGAMHQTINDLFENAAPSADLHASASVEVTLSDLLFDLMNRKDLKWIDNISMNLDLHQKDDLAGVLAAIGMNGKSLLSYNSIADSLNGITYVAIPTISDYYVATMDSTASGIANLKQVLAQLNTPETAVAKALLIKYADIALANMVNVEKTTETLTVNGETQKVYVYTNYITEKVFLNGIKAVLTEAKNDSQLKAIFPAEANIEAALDSAITSLNQQTPTDDKTDAIVLVTYTDKEGTVLGRKLSTPTFSISHIALATVSETFLGNAQNSFRLEGRRSTPGSSTYTLFITSAGQEIETGTIAVSGDKTAGICKITLSDFVEQNLLGSADADIAVKIQWDTTDTGTAIHMSVDLMNQQLIGINANITQIAAKDVTVPSDYLSTNDPEIYLDSVNTYELMNNMLAIGFPSEYIDAVLNYLEGTPVE